MTIYYPMPRDGYELIHPVRADDFETLKALINGVPRKDDWQPIPMELIREDQACKLRDSDSPWLGAHALVFKQTAIDYLHPLLQGQGELLLLTCDLVNVWVFNSTRVMDVLDESRSQVARFSDGRIMHVDRYVFKEELLHGLHVFKIRSLRVSPTFVSDRFVDLWTSAGLNGIAFKPIWSR